MLRGGGLFERWPRGHRVKTSVMSRFPLPSLPPMFRHYNQRFVSCFLFIVTHDVQTVIGCNNENETKNYKITGLTILVLFGCLLKKPPYFTLLLCLLLQFHLSII